jgi:rhodanese-related sulfurtransferase
MPADATNSYAGDVSPDEAWTLLGDDPRAVLVDVRTVPEWNFVGTPDLRPLGKQALLVEWQSFPPAGPRPDFVATVARQLAEQGVPKDAPVLLLCRSGARSRSAAIALTAAGFTRALNVDGGFEGPLDGDGHRGGVEGWKARGLPWAQG